MDGDIAELGFEVDSSQLKAANDELERMPAAGKKAETATQRFRRAMDDSNSAVMRFYNNLEKVARKTGEFIGGNLKQIALGFAAVFGVNALVQKIGAVANALDEVSKAARATNSAVEDMQALATAGELAGLGADYVASASKRMNRVLGTAIAQGKGTVGVFQQLGISAQELAALPVDERFARIADRIQELNLDASQSTAILAALGDRGGALINLLGEGGDQIRQAAEDVAKFNLAISDTEGLAIEEMNDNWTRLGYAVNGAFTQFIAFVAPTVGQFLINLANGIAFLVTNIGALEPVIAIVGPMLIAAFAPSIVAAVLSLAGAIGTNLVGAFTLLAGVIMANPLFAIAALLVGAIAAIWHFRDEISKAIGVDVTAIFKDAANVMIRSMLTAVETVQNAWKYFPVYVGSAVIGAVNAVIDGVNQIIASSIEGINRLGHAMAMTGIPGISNFGTSLMGLSTEGIANIDDPNAGATAAGLTDLQNKLKEIWSTDYAGQIGEQMTVLSDATDQATTSIQDFNTTGTGTGASAQAVKDGLKAIQDQAQKTQDAIDEMRDVLKDVFGSTIKTFFQNLREGKSVVDSLSAAFDNLADKLLDMVLNNIITGFVGSLFGGGGGLGVGMGLTGAATYGFTGNGVYGVPGLANGGIVHSPTMANIAEVGPEAVLPLARGPGGNLGVIAHANDNGASASFAKLQVNVYNNASNDNEVSVSQNANGDIDVIIDKKVANAVRRRGSQTNQAIAQTFGVAQSVKRRA